MAASASTFGMPPSAQKPPTTTSTLASTKLCAAAVACFGSQALSLTTSVGDGWPGQVLSASSMPLRISSPCVLSGALSGTMAPICVPLPAAAARPKAASATAASRPSRSRRLHPPRDPFLLFIDESRVTSGRILATAAAGVNAVHPRRRVEVRPFVQ